MNTENYRAVVIGCGRGGENVGAHSIGYVRLAASIQQGTVTASLMLRKLGAYRRQKALAIALRELGKLERTLFLLEYIRDVELRRRIHIGLNEGRGPERTGQSGVFQPARGTARPQTVSSLKNKV